MATLGVDGNIEVEDTLGSSKKERGKQSLSRPPSLSSLKDALSAFKNLTPSALTKVEFVPAIVPRRRRLQTAAVALWALMIPIMLCLFFYLCSIPILWPVIIAYLAWIHLDKAPNRGGRYNMTFRRLRWWKYFAEYYPASLKKEADLPPDRSYVFGYHPHGIIGMGAFATFATESTGFSKNFPGIKPHLLTLASNFKIPLYRDLMLLLGVCSVSKESCINILSQGSGSAICIVVGEPLKVSVHTQVLLGFLKIAIQQGADLVPVFSFGENDIYDQMPNDKGSPVYMLQKNFQRMFGFTLPLFHGRGLLNYNFGLMPHRRSIVVVVGRPVHVNKSDQPTIEDIYEVQKRYIDELTRIWDTYKDSFARHRKQELQIID